MGQISRYLLVAAIVASSASWQDARGQSYDGQVQGVLSGAAHKYSGEFTDDLWGPGAFLSIQYAPISRLQLEARFGLGEIKWKVTPSDLARFPDYFGQGAELGDPYPGTLTTIEPENESRVSTIDFLVNYIIVDDIPAVPFISAGVGWTSYAPSNSEEHDALPNFGAGVYSGNSVSFPLGGGVKIPFSDRVGIVFRGEYRIVLSRYLDDLDANGANDAITSVSVGLTYSFTEPPARAPRHYGNHRYSTVCPCCHMDVRSSDECPCGGKHDVPGSDNNEGGKADPPADESTDASGAGGAAAGAGGAAATTEDDSKTTTEDVPDEQAEPVEDVAPANIQPCPPGSARVCVEGSKSVCVDTTFVPGADRIRWENAFVYEVGNPGHLKLLKDIGSEQPCFDNVVRQMGSSFYQCIDCCFEKISLGGKEIYVILEEGELAKGQGQFTPEECPDCATVAAEGR